MNIVSFSGGKDSTAMLFMMLEKGIQIDKIISIDTTKEYPQMYEHIHKVQERIHPLKIEIYTIDFDYYFAKHVRDTPKSVGVEGYGWPGFLYRWCTGLKLEQIRKIKMGIPDIVDFIGIAFDERKRQKKAYLQKNNIRLPLVEYKITGRQALKYCYSLGFDWGGLYKKISRVSCWCCPFSRKSELRMLRHEFPDLWKQLLEMDQMKDSHFPFHKGKTVQEMDDYFYREDRRIKTIDLLKGI